jgi:hypothetical protein
LDANNAAIAAQRPKLLTGFCRYDVVRLLHGDDNVGVELGVAAGNFSERMIRSGRFRLYIGVDAYADSSHDGNEYQAVLRRMGFASNYRLLRNGFDQALGLFGDQYFDLVYYDGYTQNAEQGFKTILSWYAKLKPGGVIAGGDYHPDRPLLCEAVDEFARQSGEELMLTTVTEPDVDFARYPTWCVRKTRTSVFGG